MAETIFCIVNEQREHIYNDLRGIELVRTALTRRDTKLERYAAELKTYTESIAQLLNSLPRDPRCQEPSSSD